MIRVELVYALPLAQDICTLEVAQGTTVAQAIALSRYAKIDLAVHTVAIYGRSVTLHTVLRDHDRIEILRALRVEPREARRRRQLHRSRRGATRSD